MDNAEHKSVTETSKHVPHSCIKRNVWVCTKKKVEWAPVTTTVLSSHPALEKPDIKEKRTLKRTSLNTPHRHIHLRYSDEAYKMNAQWRCLARSSTSPHV